MVPKEPVGPPHLLPLSPTSIRSPRRFFSAPLFLCLGPDTAQGWFFSSRAWQSRDGGRRTYRRLLQGPWGLWVEEWFVGDGSGGGVVSPRASGVE